VTKVYGDRSGNPIEGGLKIVMIHHGLKVIHRE